jgi:hypothetical protein
VTPADPHVAGQTPPPADRLWHVKRAEDVAGTFSTRPDGLSEEEAAARLERDGPNQLPEQPPTSALVILLHQFRSPAHLHPRRGRDRDAPAGRVHRRSGHRRRARLERTHRVHAGAPGGELRPRAHAAHVATRPRPPCRQGARHREPGPGARRCRAARVWRPRTRRSAPVLDDGAAGRRVAADRGVAARHEDARRARVCRCPPGGPHEHGVHGDRRGERPGAGLRRGHRRGHRRSEGSRNPFERRSKPTRPSSTAWRALRTSSA